MRISQTRDRLIVKDAPTTRANDVTEIDAIIEKKKKKKQVPEIDVRMTV